MNKYKYERTDEPQIYVIASENGQYPDDLQDAIETLAVMEQENPYNIQHFLLCGYKWGINSGGWKFNIFPLQKGDEQIISECKRDEDIFFTRNELEDMIFPDYQEPEEYENVRPSWHEYIIEL